MFFNKSGDFYLFLYKKVYTFALKVLTLKINIQ